MQQFSSRIEEVASDFLVIAMPMHKGYPVSLLTGDTFSGRITSEGVAYQFAARLLGKRMSPIPVWLVSMPVHIKKIQQRSFVRMDAGLSVDVRLLPPPGTTDVQPVQMLHLFTRDISGGGLQLVAKSTIPLGTKLDMDLYLTNGEILRLLGEVVRNEQPQPDRLIWWIGVRFLEIEERDRSQIIKFVFRKQLERRHKGF